MTRSMSSSHTQPGAVRALLPSALPIEQRRPATGTRQLLDVAGGVCAAVLISLVCMRIGSMLFRGAGWPAAIAWESVWLLAALAAAPLLPRGVAHEISWRTTRDGIVLDWPELILATWTLVTMSIYIGGFELRLAPLAMSLAVGVAEEFMFRVLLVGWLVTRVSVPAAVIVGGAVFGLAHLHELSIVGLLSVLPQTAGGVILGAIYLRTRNPLGPILVHAFWDYPFFMALGVSVSGGSPSDGMQSVAQVAPWIGFMVYGLWLVRHGTSAAGRVDPVSYAAASDR